MVETSEIYDFRYIKAVAEGLYSVFSETYSIRYANLERKERFSKSVRIAFSLSNLTEEYFPDFESALSKVISEKKAAREKTALESSIQFRNILFHNLSLDQIVETISRGIFENMKRFYKKTKNKSKFSFERRFGSVFNDYLFENKFKISDKERPKLMKIVKIQSKLLWDNMLEQDYIKKQTKKQRAKFRRQVARESEVLAAQRRDGYEDDGGDFIVDQGTFKPKKKSKIKKKYGDQRQSDLIDLLDKLNS